MNKEIKKLIEKYFKRLSGKDKELEVMLLEECYEKGKEEAREEIIKLIENFNGDLYTDLEIWIDIKKDLIEELKQKIQEIK